VDLELKHAVAIALVVVGLLLFGLGYLVNAGAVVLNQYFPGLYTSQNANATFTDFVLPAYIWGAILIIVAFLIEWFTRSKPSYLGYS
jgi:uncharacterized membrane protein (Fun14 family)